MASRGFATTLKAAWQLGPRLLAYYAWYAFKLRSGLLRRQTPAGGWRGEAYSLRRLVRPARPERIRQLLGRETKKLTAEADEILKGRVRLFGGEPRPLKLKPAQPLEHWTAYTRSLPGGGDIKPVWEVGRFGWAMTLARAYWLSEDEKYAEAFWKLTETFIEANPPNLGPHWSSAQEVGLRLMALMYCYSLLAGARASSLARKEMLSRSLAQHAQRIPPSLSYAQAQNNNHLLSEALALWTAAAALPQHPKAAAWRASGRAHFEGGLRRQIHADGSYAQHSANYHRLLLQLGTWAALLAALEEGPLSQESTTRLTAATQWLLALLDDTSGGVPNLGPNDGAYIFPLSVLPFTDFRPALQAACAALSGAAALPAGTWDELALWLGIEPTAGAQKKTGSAPLRLENGDSWAYLRTAHFSERPGHADQLHLDIWWRGLNIAQDAGSYLYTAAEPWDNALAGTAVHNTLMIAGREQMTRGGRFLWLDWAQAEVVSRSSIRAIAQHNGYRAFALTHRRQVEAKRTGWLVRDQLLGRNAGEHTARLHWLLPDWPWRAAGDAVTLRSPQGAVRIQVQGAQSLTLVRAGKRVHGPLAAAPILGWASPTYAVKQPALSLIAEFSGDENMLTLFDLKPR
jgi:hypothetical protein